MVALSGTQLPGLRIDGGSNITGITLTDVKAQRARINRVNLQDSRLNQVDLSRTCLTNCILEGVLVDGIPLEMALEEYKAAHGLL